MTASKRNTDRSSAELVGKTDLAALDAHVVQPEEYDELPELTDEMVARSVPGNGADLVRRGRGRPRVENRKQQVTLRLDPDVIEAMRASGPGWQVRANDVLRGGFPKIAAANTPAKVRSLAASALSARVKPTKRQVATLAGSALGKPKPRKK